MSVLNGGCPVTPYTTGMSKRMYPGMACYVPKKNRSGTGWERIGGQRERCAADKTRQSELSYFRDTAQGRVFFFRSACCCTRTYSAFDVCCVTPKRERQTFPRWIHSRMHFIRVASISVGGR